jgi:hypothetical protein
VLVDYVNVDRTRFRPSEADSVLIVIRMLCCPWRSPRSALRAVARCNSQVVQDLGLVECIELGGLKVESFRACRGPS